MMPLRPPPGAKELQASWDGVAAYYGAAAATEAHLQPLFALVTTLREAGYDSRLRASQSLNSLTLSRSHTDGLREDQSHLTLSPDADGQVRVLGLLDGTKHRFGPVPATFGGRIRRAVEALAELPFD